MADVLTGTAMIGVLTNHIWTMVGVLTAQFVSGVSAVIDVRPRAVGSEHFVTTDFNPFAAVAGVFTDHTKRRGSYRAAVVRVFTNHTKDN